MKTVHKGLMAAGMLAAFIAAPAAAQQKAFGFGVHGAWFQSGQLAENGTTELALDNKAALGGGLEWWFGSSRRVGLRADMTHTDTPFQIEFDNNADPDSDAAQDELDEFGTVDTWFANASLMIRLLGTSPERRFAPFISLGGGMVRWDTENDAVTDLRLEPVDAQIYHEAQSEGAVFGSIGTDIFFTPSVALRLEAKDYFNLDSPYLMLSTLGSDPDHHGGTHNILWTAGLQFMFGGGAVEEPGFISVAPEPAPAPAPAPAPVVAAAPRTESVSMCVVDQSGRLELVSATRNVETGALFVTRNGREVEFSSAYPVSSPVYVKGAPWYVAAQPLVVSREKDDLGGDVDDELDDAAENRMEFVNFGATQPLPMGDVLYIGSIDGTPLYATRSDIGSLLPDLEARLQGNRDLDEVLDDEDFATRFATEIETFYTVVEPGSPAVEARSASCVFQPMSSTRVVRRTRG